MLRRVACRLWVGFAGAALLAAQTKSAIPLVWPESGAPYQVEFVESIRSPEDAGLKRSFWARFGNALTGQSEKPRRLVRPFTVAGATLDRLLITDPGTGDARLLDRSNKKYASLEGPSRQRLRSPIGAGVDSTGNLYVADSELGKIFVFRKNGHFSHFLGDAKGEGLYKRPTGLAVDQASGEIYLTETLRHKVLVLDRQGAVIREWGKRGEGAGEFNFPVAVAVHAEQVFVLDAMNFRVQVFTRQGRFVTAFGKLVNEPGGFFRPKGLAFDARTGLLFVVDAMFEVVQAFTPEGKLAFAFGTSGEAPGQFRLPSGILALDDGLLLVADPYNGRIQVFRILPSPAVGGDE
jgi:DNA-binding beta-propeller fold protein YncE